MSRSTSSRASDRASEHGASLSPSAEERIGFSHLPDRDERRPWVLVLTPPLAYLLVLGFRYALTAGACESTGARLLLEAVALVGLIVMVATGLRAWSSSGGMAVARSSDEEGLNGAHRLLLQVAVLGAAFFTLVTLATWVPSWILSPCGG